MFRPFRPAFEKLENREVFSAGPLGLAAVAQPQGVIHPFSEFAIQSNAAPPTSVASYNGGAIHFGSRVIGSPNLGPVSSNASAETDADSDGADFLTWQRQAQPTRVDGSDFLVWQRNAQPESQPTAITGSYNPSTGFLTAVPASQPTAAADFDNDGDVDGADFLAAHPQVVIDWGDGQADQALRGDGSVRFQTQVMHEEEDANDVNNITAQSHDRFFEAFGMASQRSMQQNYDLTLAQPWQ